MAAAAARLRPAACAAVVSILIVALATSVAASSSSSSSADGLPENADSEHVHGRVAAAAASLLVGAVLVVALVGGACCSRRPVPMEEQIAQPMNVAKRKPFVYVKQSQEAAGMARIHSKEAMMPTSPPLAAPGMSPLPEAQGGLPFLDFERRESTVSKMSSSDVDGHMSANRKSSFDGARPLSVVSSQSVDASRNEGYLAIGDMSYSGYVDLGNTSDLSRKETWRIPTEPDQVVVNAQGNLRRRSSTQEAFAQFAAMAPQERFIVPFEDGPDAKGPSLADFRLSDAPMAMSASTRSNPLFDAGLVDSIFDDNGTGAQTPDVSDHESEVSGVEDESDFKGFDLAEGQTQTVATQEETFDGFGDADEDEGESTFRGRAESMNGTFYGFGDAEDEDDAEALAPPKSLPRVNSALKRGLHAGPVRVVMAIEEDDAECDPKDAAKMEKYVDGMNHIKTLKLSDAEKHMKNILALLKKPGCIRECIDINGAVTIASSVKEFTEVHIQKMSLEILAMLCTKSDGAREVFQCQVGYMIVAGLNADEVWEESFMVIRAALASYSQDRLVAGTLLADGVAAPMAMRMFKHANYQGEILVAMAKICVHLDDPKMLTDFFRVLATVVTDEGVEKEVTSHVLPVLAAAVDACGKAAIDVIESTKLASALAAGDDIALASGYQELAAGAL